MSINKKITLDWKGKEYSVLITMRHVDEIEQDFNLTIFANRLSMGDCRYTQLARLIAKVLNFAGAEDVTQEMIYCEVLGGGSIDPNKAIKMGKVIASACFPEVKETTKKKSVKKKPRKK